MDFLFLIAIILLVVACWPTEKRRARKIDREIARRVREREAYALSRLRYKHETWVDELELLDPDTKTFEEIRAWLLQYNNFFLTDRYKAYLVKEKGLQFERSDLLDYVYDMSEAQFELHIK